MQFDIYDLNDCLNKLNPDAPHDEWFNILTAFKSAGGSFEQFDSWSSCATRKSSDGRPVYCQHDCKGAWDSAKKSGNPGGAYGTLCKLAGINTPLGQEAEHREIPDFSFTFSNNTPTPQHQTQPTPQPTPQQGEAQAQVQNGVDIEKYITDSAKNHAESVEYFCKRRGLSEDCVKKYRLGFDVQANAAVIPYPNNEYLVRRLLTPKDEKKKYDNPKGLSKPVFNSISLQQSNRPVWVLEGQIDVLSILDCGGEACTGLNEMQAIMGILDNAPVMGIIVAGDADNAGEQKNMQFAKRLEEKNIPYSFASMPSGVKDINEMLLKQGHDAVSQWIESQEKWFHEQNEMQTLSELYRNCQGKEDPNEIIRKRFLCKGSAMMLVSESGVGKSSLIMQMALLWSLGQPCFQLVPKKKMNILIIQAENDNFDICEEVEGIKSGAVHSHEYSLEESDIDDALTRIKIISNCSVSGEKFALFLNKQIRKDRATRDLDLVIIDPLSAYAGCDLNSQKDIGIFLRNEINPVIKRTNIALAIVHHTPKPLRTADINANFNDSYAGAGSAELTNWARAVIMLKRVVKEDGQRVFQMSAPKRGWSRLEWENNEIWLKWADRGIFWETTEKPETVTVDKPNKKSAIEKDAESERDKRELMELKAREIVKLFKSGETLSTSQLDARITEAGISSNKDKRSDYIKYCSANHLLSVRGPLENEKGPDGKKYKSNTNLYSLIETPEQQILDFIGDGSCSSDSIYSHVEDSAIFSPAQVEEALNKCVATGLLQVNGDIYCKPQQE